MPWRQLVFYIILAELCFELCLCAFVTGFAEKCEHIGLIALNTGLVERIYTENIT